MQDNRHNNSKTYRIFASVLALYFLLAAVFYWASGQQLFFDTRYSDSVSAKAAAATMTNDTVVEFPLQLKADYCDSLSVLIGTSSRTNEGRLIFELLDENGTALARDELPTAGLTDYVYNAVVWPQAVRLQGQKAYTVRVSAQDVPDDEGVTLWYGDSISTGRFSVHVADAGAFSVNGVSQEGSVCASATGRNILWIGRWFWALAGALGLAIALYGLYTIRCLRAGRLNRLLYFRSLYERYSFLIRQLVARDFKRKYKRSVLGVFWSFLNPLLTMVVQYLVFNTLFRSSISNFVVYLLSGIVVFNFFGEAVNLGLTSITDNAALINKVYMPKVIYPLSRALSAVINLLIALIPLFGATLLSGLPLTKAVFLLPLGLIMLFFFSLGLGMFLATSMVYFRDTLFLWSVLYILWSYMTPTFYPITIIPPMLQPIFRLNPLYQYITFIRTILIAGMGPAPMNYLGCFLSTVLMLAVGWSVFKKNQRKFILHL